MTSISKVFIPKNVIVPLSEQLRKNGTDIASTSLITKYLREKKAFNSTRERQEIIETLFKEQYEIERQYLDQVQKCPIQKLDKYLDKFGKVDSNSYKKLIRKNFYNTEVMGEAMCLADSIFYSQDYEIGKVSAKMRARRWLDKMTAIGVGAGGSALESDFNKTDDVFIVKVANKGHEEDLLHEFFVGLTLNNLRRYVPNFAYIMGGFKCQSPVIDKNDEVVSWCTLSEKSTIDYVLYENIAPGITLSKYSNNCSFEDWLDKYLQILYALNVAHKKHDFTHYDLHASNVVIRQLDSETTSSESQNGVLKTNKKVSIPYKTERGGIEYLNTSGIATIIDYGYSHIRKDGRNHGIYGLEHYGISSEHSHVMHDAYKLLLSSMNDMYNSGNTECFEKASNILKFFNQNETAEDILIKQSEFYYFVPYNQNSKNYELFDLTKYIRRYIPEANKIISKEPAEEIIGCDGTNVCISGNEATSIMGIDGEIGVSTIFDFYDLASRFQDEKRSADFETIKSTFEYDKNLKPALEDIETHILKYEKRRREIGTPVIVYGKTLNWFFNEINISRYKQYVVNLIGAYDELQNAAIMKDAIHYTSNIYDDNDTHDKMSKLHDRIYDESYYLENLYKNLLDDIYYIDKFLDNKAWRETIESYRTENPELVWWWYELFDLVKVL